MLLQHARRVLALNDERSQRLSAQVESVLAALETLPFDRPADEAYARMKCRTPIGLFSFRLGGMLNYYYCDAA